MGLTAKDKGGGQDFDPVPAALHIAKCYGIFDLGTHHDTMWSKDVHKIVIVWELPGERISIERDDGTIENLPRAISKRYTLSLGKKAILRQDLESWRSRAFTETELEGFDLKNILGIPCQLNVVHKPSKDGKKTYANIATIVPAPKGTDASTENQLAFFSFEEWPEKGIPVGTPEWISDIIKESFEWSMTASPPGTDGPPIGSVAPDEDDTIPF